MTRRLIGEPRSLQVNRARYIANEVLSATNSVPGMKKRIVFDLDGTLAESKALIDSEILDRLMPGFSVLLGGATSIDVTKPGIDKAYGIRKLRDVLGISLKEMIFVGDPLERFEMRFRFPAQSTC